MNDDPAPIPLVDLRAAHRQVEDEVRRGFERVCATTSFILGEDVTAFEHEYAHFVGASHCVGVSSGTDALELILRAIDVGPGDEVIVPVNTFIATALAVIRAGATPVFVDCDPNHLLIDPAGVEAKLTKRTRAILPVHLYGQLAPMDGLRALAKEAELSIIEDAAQAQGAEQGGRKAGSFGIGAATSFYPGKNLGAYGDAGAVTTDDAAIAERVRALRNYGSPRKYEHSEIGFNCRLDTLQAVVLRAKLPLLAEWNEKRREAARRYDEMLKGDARIRVVPCAPENQHIFHLYVVRVGNREGVLAHLQGAGIGASIHYPTPLHRVQAFAKLPGMSGNHPVAEAATAEILSLPMYPEIAREQQQRVVAELFKALDSSNP